MPVSDASTRRPTGESAGAASPWAEFGEQLKHYRRRAGLTQQQLGQRVGYHHSLISKWEGGAREPAAGAVESLDRVLGANGALSSLGAPPARRERPPYAPLGSGFFAPIPGGSGRRPPVPAQAAGHWPSRLAPGACPLHTDGTACSVPDFGDLSSLPGRLRAARQAAVPAAAEPEVIHTALALLDGCEQIALRSISTTVLGTVEHVLRGLVTWAEAVNSAGRPPLVLLRVAAHYAQLAGRLRMQRGQSALAMAWVCHGLRWGETGGDTPVRATLMTDLCTLARLDGDGASSLAYAQALAGLDGRRGWIATLSHLYQARGYAATGDGAESRRQTALSRWGLERLSRRDLEEAPWLTAGHGQLRVESAVAGGLRDLAAVTGNAATARSAVAATERALEQVPEGMTPTRLLLTLRLADCHACAGDPDTALQLAGPAVQQAVSARRRTISRELEGVRARLSGAWGGVREVREFKERVAAAVETVEG